MSLILKEIFGNNAVNDLKMVLNHYSFQKGGDLYYWADGNLYKLRNVLLEIVLRNLNVHSFLVFKKDYDFDLLGSVNQV